MTEEERLRDKLRKIEALFARAGTPGEREAAKAALTRLRARLAAEFPPQSAQSRTEPNAGRRQAPPREPEIALRFSLPDPWSRRLFVALCREHGLKPYRTPRQRRTTVMVMATRDFADTVLMPEFAALNKDLGAYLDDVARAFIRQRVAGRARRAA
jgi:hypothetical protein